MTTVDEYQTYARDCLRWAAKAPAKNSASSYYVWQEIGRKPPRRSTLGLSQAISTSHWHGPRDLWAERAQAIASPVGWQSIAPAGAETSTKGAAPKRVGWLLVTSLIWARCFSNEESTPI